MIILYSGRRGCGKTLTMIKDALRYQENGWPIYSNIALEIPHTLLTTEEIINIGKSDLKDCVLLIDEIQVLVDSRRSARSGNLDFSYFIQQIRKRNITILCTTQFSGTVDLRLRQHVDIIARPRFDKKLLVCAVMYIDATVESMTDLYSEPMSIEIVYDARDVFRFYDTKNIIVAQKPAERRKSRQEKQE